MPISRDKAASPAHADEAGAPDYDEIEVTTEMVEAGVEAFRLFDVRWVDAESVVSQIFLAMERARTSSDNDGTR